MITADHGNAEQMLDSETHQQFTAHTRNMVPVILVGKDVQKLRLRDGTLQDVAPTLLVLLGIDKPAEMTGDSLILKETIS